MMPRQRLRRLMLVYAALLFGFGLWVLCSERTLFQFLDLFRLVLPIGAALDPPADSYWSFVVVSLVWTLGLACTWAAADVDQGRRLVRLLIYCKTISGGLMVAHFARNHAPAAYFFGGLTDLALAVIAAVYYLRAFPGGLRDLLVPGPGPTV